MRIMVLILCFFLLLISAALAFYNEPDGFRGLKWSDLPTDDMIPIKCISKKEDKWNQCFYRPNDKMAIGSVPFYRIVYSFYYSEPAQLMSATLSFREVDDYKILETILKATFGEPTKSTTPLFAYEDLWVGNRTVIELHCAIFGDKYLKFHNPQILAEKKKTDKQKEIDEAQDDF